MNITPLTQDNPLTITAKDGVFPQLGGNLLSNTTIDSNYWSFPVLLETILTEDGVEQIFKQDCLVTYTIAGYNSSPSPRVYKNVYKIIEGKLKLTETIEGRYLPAKDESYEFD